LASIALPAIGLDKPDGAGLGH